MKRYLDGSVKENLINSDLWQQKIKDDCVNQIVFFTIRENRVDIYHKGGKLFSFDKDKDFKTHIKYAAVIDPENDNDQYYLSESSLRNMKLSPDYFTGYDGIKANCSKYSGVEAAGVSAIYHNHSYFSQSNVVVLDIEISFSSLQSDLNKMDRIDLLLLDKTTGKLQFVEAKHFSNNALWSKTKPPVINQLDRYNGQIRDKEAAILEEYKEYVKCLNSIFGVSLPSPTGIEEQVSLLIFGFDDDQKKGRLKSLVNKNVNFKGVKTYQIGNVKKLNTTTLWNGKIL